MTITKEQEGGEVEAEKEAEVVRVVAKADEPEVLSQVRVNNEKLNEKMYFNVIVHLIKILNEILKLLKYKIFYNSKNLFLSILGLIMLLIIL
jgi:hypothetical protein